MLTEKLREHLLRTIPEDNVKRWFDPLRLDLGKEDKLVRVVFPHPFFGEWFIRNIREVFERETVMFLGPGYSFVYGDNPAAVPAQVPPGPDPGPEPENRSGDLPFGREFTFDTFLANDKNYFPLASAREVAAQNNVGFNPFLICGESGTGKTHLLKSMANEMFHRHGFGQIYCGSIEDMRKIYAANFSNDAVAARNYFCGFNFLLVDDFQAIEEHPRLQQEVIALFNFFHENNRQMVFACAGKMAEYDFLDPKLKSRLSWGLLVFLKKPDLDVRSRFIQDMCRKHELRINRERILGLAQRFQDFRSLQGVMLRIFAFRELVKKDFTDQDLEQVISAADGQTDRHVSPEAIIRTVAEHFQIGQTDLLSGKRSHALVVARQTAMFLCRSMLGLSYPRIGLIFGGKDHGTALYAVKKIEQLQKDNKDMKNLLKELKKKCLQAPA